jgi:alkyl hydroperoxide reductase subunit AhpC
MSGGKNCVTTPWCQQGECYNQASIGKPAPYFECGMYFQNDIKRTNLAEYKGKWVVLFFYPKDFTFVCPTEILAFSDASKDFENLDCQLLGASCDNEHVHFAWCSKPRTQGGLGIDLAVPLLSDTTQCMGILYGSLFLDGPNAGLSNRATFIIDPQGIMRHISYSDLPIGRNPEETLRLVEALQFADKHGEVCPAKWKKGNKTLEPKIHSQKTKEYFETANDELNSIVN